MPIFLACWQIRNQSGRGGLAAPCIVFINRIDAPKGRVRDIIAALQDYSNHPLVMRQVPICMGEAAKNFGEGHDAFLHVVDAVSKAVRGPMALTVVDRLPVDVAERCQRRRIASIVAVHQGATHAGASDKPRKDHRC